MARSWWIRGVGLTGIGTFTLWRSFVEGGATSPAVIGVLFLLGGLGSLFMAQRKSRAP